MKTRFTNINYGVLVLCLIMIFASALTMEHVKPKPQVYLISLGVSTFLALLSKAERLSGVLFVLLLAYLSYISVNALGWYIIQQTPMNNGAEIDGVFRHTMEMRWIYWLVGGIIASILSVVFYIKKVKRERVIEIAIAFCFIVSHLAVFIYHEYLS